MQLIRARKCESTELNGMMEKVVNQRGFSKSFINSLTNKLTKQFRKTAFYECLLVLKGGELVDYEVNSHIKCECTIIGFTVRRIP